MSSEKYSDDGGMADVPVDMESRIRLVMKLRGVAGSEIISALERTPREKFVDSAFINRAYEDVALPILGGQTISQPSVVAMMTEALQVTPRCKVLEIGTGSGYQAAVLSHLCRRVYTVERRPELASKKANLPLLL
jgi:protein-L-isoaspartate(D-aspartate) O-methyltransferase